MKLKKLHNTLFLLLGLTAASCADEATCIPEHTDLLQLAFYGEDGKAKTITVVSLEAEGSNENFPVIQDSTFNTMAIPLNPLDTIIKLNFIQESQTNTLTLSYSATQRLTDPKCGLETMFDHLEIDNSNFLNAEIVNSVLNKDFATNVKITH